MWGHFHWRLHFQWCQPDVSAKHRSRKHFQQTFRDFWFPRITSSRRVSRPIDDFFFFDTLMMIISPSLSQRRCIKMIISHDVVDWLSMIDDYAVMMSRCRLLDFILMWRCAPSSPNIDERHFIDKHFSPPPPCRTFRCTAFSCRLIFSIDYFRLMLRRCKH